jgi:hypothetical protein
LEVLRFELRALCWCSIAWASLHSFLFWLFLREGLAWTTILLSVLPTVVGVTGTCPCAQPLVERGSYELFGPAWPEATVLWIFTSWVARTTGVSHCPWLRVSLSLICSSGVFFFACVCLC